MSLSNEPLPLSLYIHVPFCRTRCSYCTFNTYAGLEDLIPQYVSAVCCEIAWLGARLGFPVLHTVYFGGGTPSILTVEQIASILEAVRSAFDARVLHEVTLEANPQYVDVSYFQRIRSLGVNRLSIGVQSAQENELRRFGRRHQWSDVVTTVASARAGGFNNINFDLIYGAPGQSMASWKASLIEILKLAPNHIALYALTIEPGTLMAKRVDAGLANELDDDLIADMYDAATSILSDAGFAQYEISNWSVPGYECQHNLQYWRRNPYLAIGPGAYGYVDNVRYGAVDAVSEYIDAVSEYASGKPNESSVYTLAEDVNKRDLLSESVARTETLILGLRMLGEGVSQARYSERFGHPAAHYHSLELEQLVDNGLLHVDQQKISLTQVARLISNQVMVEFV